MGTQQNEAQAKLDAAADLIAEACNLDPDVQLAMTAMGANGRRYYITHGNDYVLLGLIEEMRAISVRPLVMAYAKSQIQEQSRIVKPQMVPLNGGKR